MDSVMDEVDTSSSVCADFDLSTTINMNHTTKYALVANWKQAGTNDNELAAILTLAQSQN